MVSDNHDTNEPTEFNDAVERGQQLARENAAEAADDSKSLAQDGSKNAGTDKVDDADRKNK